MKITGASNEPIRPERRRTVTPGLAAPVGAPGAVDQVTFLGISRSEMTPAVIAAIEALIGELDPDVEPETLIADADAAMFAAKRVRKTG